jgi:hypothetical protein
MSAAIGYRITPTHNGRYIVSALYAGQPWVEIAQTATKSMARSVITVDMTCEQADTYNVASDV